MLGWLFGSNDQSESNESNNEDWAAKGASKLAYIDEPWDADEEELDDLEAAGWQLAYKPGFGNYWIPPKQGR